MSKDDDTERDSQDEAQDEKPEAEKEEPKAEAKKEEPKAEAKKEEPKKAEAKKEEPKKAEAKKEEPKKAEAKKEEPKKAEAKKKAAAREAVSERPAATKEKKADHAEAHGHHKPNRREYVVIWAWLAGLTVLEVGVAYTQSVIGKVALVTALVGLALAKAACVALFYMHLKHETKVMRWTVAVPLMFPALYAFILIAEGIYRSLWGGGT